MRRPSWKHLVAAAGLLGLGALGVALTMLFPQPPSKSLPCPIHGLGCAVPTNPVRPFSVSITSPTSNATVSGTASVAATTMGPGVTITQVQLLVDGILSATKTSAPYTFSWNTSGVGNGNHSLVAVAFSSGVTRSSPTVPVIVSNSGGQLANVWVSANGNDAGAACSRSAGGITLPAPTTVCKTMSKAYQWAQPGDTVLLTSAGGSFPRQAIPYTLAKSGAHCDWNVGGLVATSLFFVSDYSGCITFSAAAGNAAKIGGLFLEVPYVNLNGTTGGGTISFDRNDPNAPTTTDFCPNQTTGCVYGHVEIQLGGGFTSGAYNCYGDTAGGRPQQQPHDEVIQNITSNDTFVVDGAQHAAFLNDVFTVGDNFRPNNATSHVQSCGSNDGILEPNQYNLWQGVTMKDGSAQVPAFGTTWTLEHSEAIHFDAGTHDVFNANKFLNLNGHALFGESEVVPGINDVVLENNLVDTPCSQQVTGCHNQGPPWFGFTGHVAGINVVGAVIRDNTFLPGVASVGPFWNADNGTVSGSSMYGNAIAGSMQSCASMATASISVSAYANISTGGPTCGAGSQVVSSLGLTSTPEDGTPLPGSPVIDFVPTSVTGGFFPTDLLAAPRPDLSESFIDAGAYETQGVG